MTDWRSLSARATFASHRLVGWIFWDPVGVERYAALGIPNGVGYYVTTHAGHLVDAGADVVAAAYYTIHPDFIRLSVDELLKVATAADAIRVRDEAVVDGLCAHVPEICDVLATLAQPLWAAADTLPLSGRALFAVQLRHRRVDDPLLSAWLAVNCVREWRGDTHFAIQTAEDLTGTEAGILDGAWRNYDDDWLPRSRGADDVALSAGYARLERRGFAAGGTVTPAGIAYRADLEDRLDDLSAEAWRHLGEADTVRFCELVESVGDRLIERVDLTAGEKWMPAGRHHDRKNP